MLLRRLGVEPMVYIPDRLMEGYGPSGAALVELKTPRREPGDHRRLRRAGVRGAAGGGATPASTLSSATITNARPAFPPRIAMINPNRLDESEIGAAHGHVAAVGMAFLLGVALLRELREPRLFRRTTAEPKLIDLLDIVALGTVADVARLKTLNRAFVTQGLKVMAERQQHRPRRAGRGGAAGEGADAAATSASRWGRGSTPAAASASPTSASAC